MTDDRLFDRDALKRYVSHQTPDRAEPVPPQDRFTLASVLALAAGNGADGLSTIYALKHGVREANPVFGRSPHPAKVAAIKGATTVAEWLMLKKLAKDHPKLANGLAKGIGAAMAGVAAHNVYQGRKAGGQ